MSAAGAIFQIVVVEVGSINMATDVLVGVRIERVDAGVGVEMFALSADGVVVVDRGAPTLSELGMPVVKKPIVLIPRKSPIVRYAIFGRNKLLCTTTSNLLKSYNKFLCLFECE